MPDTLKRLAYLAENIHRFDFFQALRLLECLSAEQPRLGESLRPAEDSVRLGQNVELTFAPTALAAFESWHENEEAASLKVNFFGLFGPNGPLPLHLTEYARDRARNAGDKTLVGFLDIFHHRMLSLFFRAWAVAQPVVSLDRPQSDRFSIYVRSLLGIGGASSPLPDAIPVFAKLHLAGILVMPTRHASGLRQILASFFALPTEIEEAVGDWIELPDDARSSLGVSGNNAELGISTILGRRVWDCQHKFRIVLGPLVWADYLRFLPGSDGLKQLRDWVDYYIRDGLKWELKLYLKKEEALPLRLGRQARLGYSSWLANQPLQQDPFIIFKPSTLCAGQEVLHARNQPFNSLW